VLPQETSRRWLLTKTGDTFSRAFVEATTNTISLVLSNIGYAFAEVTPVPEVDREKHIVGINYVVKPGPRVTVRRILFKGNASTDDEVLRRECASSRASSIRRR
jgi:outer membrane protein insertion porin family